MHLAQPRVARQAAIAREAPAQAALPRVARDQAAQARGDDEALEHDGAGCGADGAEEELEDGHEGRRRDDVFEVADDGEEHGHGPEPGGYEADENGAHDGDGDHCLGKKKGCQYAVCLLTSLQYYNALDD